MSNTNTTLKSAHDGFELTALHVPAQGQRRGGVVVIQEIFGVTDHIAEMCSVFAAAGYDAIAPSFYDRIERGFLTDMSEEGIAKARAALPSVKLDEVAGDIQAALDALPKPAYVTGFCWGGSMAWLAAARCKGVSAASGFYGRMIPEIPEQPKAPVMLHYGARDASIPPENVEAVRARAADSPIYIYDAGHGFCRKGSHDYNPEARELAVQRTLDWFARWR